MEEKPLPAGSPRANRLTWKLFAFLLPLVVFISLALYAFSVPLIKAEVYKIERHGSRNVLDAVSEIASRIQHGLQTHRRQTLQSHKRELKTVVALAEAYIGSIEKEVESGDLSRAAARQLILDNLRSFKYGRNDYIWVSDYRYRLVSHPDPDFHERDVSDWRDAEGNLIVPPMVEIARRDGNGFFSYKWRRLGKTTDSEKVSYFKDFPGWGFVLGSGVYLDDVEAEVERRKQEAITDLRKSLRDVKLSQTGYVYVFDSAANMIIHPNPNIEHTNFADLTNPTTGNPIAADLMAASDQPSGLQYKWDHPDDPGSYVYDKIAWIRYLEGLDWYIASSVYEDELKVSSEILSERVFWISAILMVVTALMGWFFIRHLTGPIRKLAETAAKVQKGDLTATTGIVRDDEIGLLSDAFDHMVEKLRGSIDDLDQKVRERTKDLEESNIRLQEAVAEQRLARDALEDSEARQRLILDAQPAQIAYVDRESQYLLFGNRAFLEFNGLECGKVSRVRLAEVFGDAVFAQIRIRLEDAFEGSAQDFEREWHKADGNRTILKHTFIPHRQGAEVAGVFLVALDVTEERQAARSLLEAQRMRAVGQLSGGLAHDFNNLLSIILGNLLTAQERVADQTVKDDVLEPAVRATRRGADITSRLLAFSRRQSLKPTSLLLLEAVEDAALLLKGTLPSNVSVSIECPDPDCRAFADPAQLENALINLGLNARDAMPEGGQLTFVISRREVGPEESYDEPIKPASYVCIEVLDEGAGFSDEALDRGVEPFFSTKGPGTGSGLGLSMVYGFIKQSSGYFIAENRKHKSGARVGLLLPPGREPSAIERPGVVARDPHLNIGKGALALLVEDEPDVRKVVQTQLSGIGFTVLEAASADEAVNLLQAVEDVELLVSDIIMPGNWNGHELALEAGNLRPGLPIVLISGFDFEEAAPVDGTAAFVLLRKPFDKHDLIEAVQKARAPDSELEAC
ncbi:MAG: cache domain-containing protein [Magnetovibrionaceae bacterium]